MSINTKYIYLYIYGNTCLEIIRRSYAGVTYHCWELQLPFHLNGSYRSLITDCVLVSGRGQSAFHILSIGWSRPNNRSPATNLNKKPCPPPDVRVKLLTGRPPQRERWVKSVATPTPGSFNGRPGERRLVSNVLEWVGCCFN